MNPPKCEHTIFHERCTECLAIQADCYFRLKTEGFRDIEDTQHPDRLLKTWHSFKFCLMDKSKRDAPSAYYEAAAELLHTYPFQEPVHEYIWMLHCEGKSKRQIEALVGRSDFKNKYKRESILNIITKIAKEIIR